MSRIGEVSETDYDGHTDLVATIEAGRGFVPNVFRTMLYSPAATEGWVSLANAVRLESSLDDRTRELVVLLVAQLNESDYEWRHHARVAGRLGITDTELDWLATWPNGDWSETERAVLTVAEATAARTTVPQASLDHLLDAAGHRFVVDLTVLTSYYVAVAHFTHALAIEPEAGG